jgi:hypothetical protein
MKYENEVTYKIELVNSILNELNALPLEINKDFIIDETFHQKHYVKFKIQIPGSIALQLIFVSDALQINIDRTNESFEWSNKQIEDNENAVKDFIKMIFTCSIMVKYCGLNYTKIYFYNADRHCIYTFKFITGFYLNIHCKTKEYVPIYQN